MNSRLWLLGFAAAICASCAPACAETFQQALVQAYETSPDLQAEQAKLREVDEEVSQALSNWRPSIDATGSIGKSYQNINDPATAPIPSLSSALTPKTAGVQITQPIFRGFRTVSQTRAAEKKVAAERANLEAVEQKLFLDSGTTYLDVVRDQALVELDRNNEDVLRQEQDAVNQRYSAGELTKTDVHQAESRLKRAEADRIQAEGNLSNHKATYARLIGLMPGALQQPELELDEPKNLDEATALANKQNPNVLAASYGEDEAKEEVDLNKGSLLPEVDLVGSSQRQWDQSTFIPGQQDTSQVLVQVTIPLYHSGSDYSKTRAAQHQVTERRMRLEEARRQAHEDAASAWQDLMTARGSFAADKEEEQAAELALKDVKEQAIVGTRTTLDVLNAEQELIDAKTGVIKAEHDIAVAILQIRSATGTLTAEVLKLPVHLYDPDKNYQNVRGKWFGFADTDDYDHEDKDVSALAQKVSDTSDQAGKGADRGAANQTRSTDQQAPTAGNKDVATDTGSEKAAQVLPGNAVTDRNRSAMVNADPDTVNLAVQVAPNAIGNDLKDMGASNIGQTPAAADANKSDQKDPPWVSIQLRNFNIVQPDQDNTKG